MEPLWAQRAGDEATEGHSQARKAKGIGSVGLQVCLGPVTCVFPSLSPVPLSYKQKTCLFFSRIRRREGVWPQDGSCQYHPGLIRREKC